MTKKTLQSVKNEPLPASPAEDEKNAARIDYEKGKEFYKNADFGQAAGAFHNALLGFEQQNDEKGLANAVAQLGEICLKRQDYAGAISHFGRAYGVCEKFGDRLSLISLKKKLAEAQFGARQYDETIRIYLDLLDSYQGFNNPDGAVKVLIALADVYIAKGEPENAADSYRTAASIYANFKHLRHAEDLLAKAEAIKEKCD